MIARLEVTRGSLTEYPLAEKVCGGWQNGVMFYPDAEVTKVTPLIFRNETPTDDEREDMIAFLLRDHNFEESPWGRTYTDAEIANALRRSEVPEPRAARAYSSLEAVAIAQRYLERERRTPEPQGEPSDARHVAHVTVECAYESDCLEGECVHRDEDGEPEDMSVCPNVPPFEVCVGCMEDEGRGSDPEQWDDVPLMPWPCPAALRAAGGVR